jgi:hypothetical protein
VDAQPHENVLWVNKPVFPGSFLIVTKNYHAGDFNLFYMNVRNNAKQRVAAFLGEEKKNEVLTSLSQNPSPVIDAPKEKETMQAKGVDSAKKKDN